MSEDGAAAALDALLAALRARLEQANEAAFAQLLGEGDAADAAFAAGCEELPVCRHWPAALAAARAGGAADLARPLAALAPHLVWVQNPTYRRRPPDPGFLANYGYAVLAGPADGPPAPLRHRRLAFGLLLLGPETHYPLHRHPATELYCPLNEALWWSGDGPWRRLPPGSLLHHAPMLPHATRTEGGPLAALYLWRGDLATPARLVGSSPAAAP